MTDEQIIDTLANIRDMCLQRHLSMGMNVNLCKGCKFEVYKPSKKRNTCQITQFIGSLCADPHCWDMELIEEVLKK